MHTDGGDCLRAWGSPQCDARFRASESFPPTRVRSCPCAQGPQSLGCLCPHDSAQQHVSDVRRGFVLQCRQGALATFQCCSRLPHARVDNLVACRGHRRSRHSGLLRWLGG
eukprot:Amastigsp_a340122_146.p3 type:complete len:111 gc:universal Amastigsp_a340122_146:177-509(+)